MFEKNNDANAYSQFRGGKRIVQVTKLENLPNEIFISNILRLLDDNSLAYLAECSMKFFQLTVWDRLFRHARRGNIRYVKASLIGDEDALKTILTKKVAMSWANKGGETIIYCDTLLQLAWRMRNIRLFDCIKTVCDAVCPILAPLQILTDFKGRQSDSLEDYGDKIYAAGMAMASALWGLPRQDNEADNAPEVIRAYQLWQVDAGQAALRIYHQMSWVMHLQCNNIWSSKRQQALPLDDEAFDIGQVEVVKTRLFVGQSHNNGQLGSTWAPTDSLYGNSKPFSHYDLDYPECAEWSGSMFKDLLYRLQQAEKLRIADMKEVLENAAKASNLAADADLEISVHSVIKR